MLFMWKDKCKKTLFVVGMLFLVFGAAAACTVPVWTEEEKIPIEFTIVSTERLSEELQEIVETKKEQEFKVTYADDGYLYICVGYGKQDGGGYSVTVDELYETESCVYVNTGLLGPKTGNNRQNDVSYPYIVIKMEFRDKVVVFD